MRREILLAMHLLLLCAVAIPLNHTESAGKRAPHIFFVLVDDLGSADVGFTRNAGFNPATQPEVQTPTLDQLAAEGVLLRRHYVHYVCTPTRSAVQTGRLPVHVQLSLRNPDDPTSGIPRNMSGLPEALRKAGANYSAHLIGKWDAGMATPAHSPVGRGYNSSLHYWEHMNDYWTQRAVQTKCYNATDLWDTDRPAKALRGTQFEEFIFRDRMLDIIDDHDPQHPLLLFYTPHVAHMPLQVPAQYLDRFIPLTNGTDERVCGGFKFPCNPPNPMVVNPTHPGVFSCRAQYHASVSLLDDVIGEVTQALKRKSMWTDTLMIFSSDNGGPININSNAANNFPLRGGKFGPFEGGIRSAAFVSGGFLPPSARGSECHGMVSVADWLGTLARLAGDPNPVDEKAANAVPAVPPIDSVDVWPMVIGANTTSPRTMLPVDETTILIGDHKLIVTPQHAPAKVSGWTGPVYPNTTTPDRDPSRERLGCLQPGCLFDVVRDPTEHNDLVASQPALAQQMLSTLKEERVRFWENHDKGRDACPSGWTNGWWGTGCACWMAAHVHGDNETGPWLGPYQE